MSTEANKADTDAAADSVDAKEALLLKSPAKKKAKLTQEEREQKQKEREEKQREREEKLKEKEERKKARELQRKAKIELQKKHAEEMAQRKKEQEEARQRKKIEEERKKKEREEALRKKREEKKEEEERKKKEREEAARKKREEKEEEERKKKEKVEKAEKSIPKLDNFFFVSSKKPVVSGLAAVGGCGGGDPTAAPTASDVAVTTASASGPFKPYELQSGTAWFRPWLVLQAPKPLPLDVFAKTLHDGTDPKVLFSEFTEWAKKCREKSMEDMKALRAQKVSNFDYLPFRRKLLRFDENGKVFRGRLEASGDKAVHPRNFLAKVPGIDYDYDSEAEWDEPSGDEIGSEDENSDTETAQQQQQQVDEDGGDPFIVSDDYLSEEEGTEGEREELMAINMKKSNDGSSSLAGCNDVITCVGVAFDLVSQPEDVRKVLSSLPVRLLNPYVEEDDKEKVVSKNTKEHIIAASSSEVVEPALPSKHQKKKESVKQQQQQHQQVELGEKKDEKGFIEDLTELAEFLRCTCTNRSHFEPKQYAKKYCEKKGCEAGAESVERSINAIVSVQQDGSWQIRPEYLPQTKKITSFFTANTKNAQSQAEIFKSMPSPSHHEKRKRITPKVIPAPSESSEHQKKKIKSAFISQFVQNPPTQNTQTKIVIPTSVVTLKKMN